MTWNGRHRLLDLESVASAADIATDLVAAEQFVSFSARTARTTSPAFVAMVLKWSYSIRCCSQVRSTASTRAPSIDS